MNQRGGAIYGLLAAIGLVVVLLALFFAGCFANAGAQRSLGPVQLVSHERDGCWDDGYDDCGRGGGRYRNEYGNRGDQRRCTGDNCRGSFSPGPFDRSPLDFRNACISLNCSGRDDNRDRDRRDEPPPGEGR